MPVTTMFRLPPVAAAWKRLAAPKADVKAVGPPAELAPAAMPAMLIVASVAMVGVAAAQVGTRKHWLHV